MDRDRLKKAGGTEGGCGLFTFGFLLTSLGLYLFFDSVRVTTGHHGIFSGYLHGAFGGGGGMWNTTSMGLVFVPLFIGVIFLFFDAKWKVGWVVSIIGLAIMVIEILSAVRFILNVKSSHLILLIVMVAAGLGLILRSFKEKS